MPFIDHILYQNPEDVITSPLPALLVGDSKTESTGSSALRHMYIGELGVWQGFEEDVDRFYKSKSLQEAFKRCERIKTDIDPCIIDTDSHFATAEHIQVAAEIDLDGRFKQNAVQKVRAALLALWKPVHAAVEASVDKAELPIMPVLPMSFNAGSSKTVPKTQRSRDFEPDIVFKIPGTGENQRVRLIGELKNATCHRIGEKIDDPKSGDRGSLRNFLGQAARDMLAYQTRFGFVSTYDETIFLKIDQRGSNPSQYALYYSRIVDAKNTYLPASDSRPVVLSTRLALLYMLHRVADTQERNWSLEGLQFKKSGWYRDTKTVSRKSNITPQNDQWAEGLAAAQFSHSQGLTLQGKSGAHHDASSSSASIPKTLFSTPQTDSDRLPRSVRISEDLEFMNLEDDSDSDSPSRSTKANYQESPSRVETRFRDLSEHPMGLRPLGTLSARLPDQDDADQTEEAEFPYVAYEDGV